MDKSGQGPCIETRRTGESRRYANGIAKMCCQRDESASALLINAYLQCNIINDRRQVVKWTRVSNDKIKNCVFRKRLRDGEISRLIIESVVISRIII